MAYGVRRAHVRMPRVIKLAARDGCGRSSGNPTSPDERGKRQMLDCPRSRVTPSDPIRQI